MVRAKLLPSLGAGFSLMAREPLAVVAWGLTYFLLTVAPSILVMRAAGPQLIDYYRQVLSNPSNAGSVAQPPALEMMQGLEWIQMLSGLAAVALVFNAIQRAVLYPGERRFFYMRLSWAEARTALIVVVLYVLFLVAMVVGAILLTLPIGVFIIATGSDLASHLVGLTGMLLLAVFIFLAAIGYPFVRLTMAIPMSLGEKRLRLFEAWTMTRGYGWPLFGLGLIQLLVMLLIELVILAVVMVAVAGAVRGFDIAHLQAFFGQPDWAQKSKGWLALVGIVYAVLMFGSLPILVAPWARAYQAITGDKTASAVDVFE